MFNMTGFGIGVQRIAFDGHPKETVTSCKTNQQMPPQLQSINACPLQNTIQTLDVANIHAYPAIFAHCDASFVLLPCPYASQRITLSSKKKHEFIMNCYCKLSQFNQILSALPPGLAEWAKPLNICYYKSL